MSPTLKEVIKLEKQSESKELRWEEIKNEKVESIETENKRQQIVSAKTKACYLKK